MRNIVANAVFLKDNNVLLEKRKKSEDNYAGLWSVPGGHKNKSEPIKKALIREMKEELGIKIKIAEPLGRFDNRDPTSKNIYSHHFFFCKKWEGRIKKTKEQEGIKWIALSRIKNLKNMNKVSIKALKKAKLI
ncbi:MAG: NUDIX hydrolase [Candidatus Woesearchaeota archaeon]